MTDIKPANNRILVKLIQIDDPVYGEPITKKIILSDEAQKEATAEKRSPLYRVLAVGANISQFSVNDIVIRANMDGSTAFAYQDQVYRLLSEADVIGTLVIDESKIIRAEVSSN